MTAFLGATHLYFNRQKYPNVTRHGECFNPATIYDENGVLLQHAVHACKKRAIERPGIDDDAITPEF